MLKKISGLAFLCWMALSAGAQDIHFSQYNLTPLLINPAQSGAFKNFEVIANYKSQWTSISPNAYKTAMLTYDTRLLQKKWKTRWLCTGITLFTDKAGDGNMKTNQFNATFGYHVQMSEKHTLGGALIGGVAQRSIDYTKLTWDEQYVNGAYDPNASSNEPAGENSFMYPDFGLGVLYQFNKGQMYASANDMVVINAGISVYHLNRPKYSFYGDDEQLYMRVTGHLSGLFGIKNTNLALAPGFLYMSQGPSSEILPGCYFRYMLREESKFTGYVKGASLMIGTHLRVNDAFIPSIQLEIAEYTLGFSYDMNMSGLKSATSGKGGIEISLRYGNPNPFLYKAAASFQ